MIDSSAAARLLRIEGPALGRVLRRAPAAAFSAPVPAAGGRQVRSLLAQCVTELHRMAAEDAGSERPGFSGESLESGESAPDERLVDEIVAGYPLAAAAAAAAGGRLDGAALGLWLRGGDIRDALGQPDAYTSPGVELAVELLVERSARVTGLPRVLADLPDQVRYLGPGHGPQARLVADVETLVRLLAGRPVDPARYHLEGMAAADLVLIERDA